MSLATRCTACGTIFRVVQDQLRVSEGWVRCGRCAEVFDARLQLFDMEREAPPPWTAPQAMPLAPEVEPSAVHEPASAPFAARPSSFGEMRQAPAAPVQPPSRPPAAHMAEADHEPEHEPGPEPEPAPERSPDRAPRGAAPEYEKQSLDEPAAAIAASSFETRIEPSFEANFAASVEDDAPVLQPSMSATHASAAAQAPAEAVAPGTAAEPTPPRRTKAAKAESSNAPEHYVPSFMRHGQDRERSGRRRRLRAALIAGAGALGVLLGLQAALHWRDAIAAAYPPARGALEALCGLGHCRIEPWRRIDVLSVENSALAQAGTGNQYQLTVSLHNKAGYEVALPWIDLSLTDPSGVVIARRALAPKDFRLGLDGKPASIAAGAEQSLQVVLNTGDQRVSGYTVEIFNP